MASLLSPGGIPNPFEAIKSSIISEFDSLILNLNLRRTELLNRLEDFRQEWENRTEKHRKSIEKLNTMKIGIEALCIKDNDVAQIHDASLKPILENLALLKEKVKFPRIVYKNREIISFSEIINNLGEIYDATNEPTKCDSEINSTLKLYKNRTDPISTIDTGGSANGLIINEISFNQNNKYLLFTSRLKHNVFCFTIEGQFVSKFGEKHLIQPFGIFSYLDFCFITDESLKGVFKFKISNCEFVDRYKVLKIGRKDDVSIPNAIDGDIVKSIIYLFEPGDNILSLWTFDFKYIRKIDLKKSYYPHARMKIFNNCIFLCDNENEINFIRAISLEGEELYSLVARKYFPDVGHPLDFCIDSSGNFIIINSCDSSIKVFSNGGDFLCSIGSQVDPKPLCICIAEDKIVCGYFDGSIRMY